MRSRWHCAARSRPRQAWRASAQLALIAALVLAPLRASADEPAVEQALAVWPFDALGIDEEIALRLESLFRTELERMTRQPLASRREIERAAGARLGGCTGEPGCLAEIGKRVGADLVIAGNVAALADSYVFNLKVVDAAAGTELRRVQSDALRGNPDELIDAVRVAAYRLVAPDRLFGSIAVLTDLVGASVFVDGTRVGTTPLAGPIDDVPLGPHPVRVDAAGYAPFEETVEVRFQKTSRVVVRLARDGAVAAEPLSPSDGPLARRPWYDSPWLWVAAGVAVAAAGGYVGYRLARDPVTDCSASPEACQ